MAREVPSIFREKSVKGFDVFSEGCYVKVAMERGRLSFAYSEDGTDFDSKYMIGVSSQFSIQFAQFSIQLH